MSDRLADKVRTLESEAYRCGKPNCTECAKTLETFTGSLEKRIGLLEYYLFDRYCSDWPGWSDSGPCSPDWGNYNIEEQAAIRAAKKP